MKAMIQSQRHGCIRTPIVRKHALALWFWLLGLAMAPVAHAAVPMSIPVQGALVTSGGGPVADGLYDVTFRLFAAEQFGNPLWTEGPVQVSVQHGLFSYALGTKTPITQATLAGLQQAWLAVQVASDPELPRKALQSVPFSLRAGLAEGIDCSGCVQLAQLAPDVLKAFAKSTDLANVAFTGSFADLSGKPAFAKLGTACGSGLVVQGLAADGTLQCVANSSVLPVDGLDAVSNNLLTVHFDETTPGKTGLPIPDNNPVGVTDVIDFADVGLAQAVTISVDLENSDLSTVKVTLIDPKGATYVLFDKGQKGAALKGTWPEPNKLVSGDLSTWLGKNLAGKWYLTVTDLGFLNNKTDGQLNAWSISVRTLSSQKVAATAGFQFKSYAKHPVACTASQLGFTYVNTTDKSLYICNGKDFYALPLAVPGSQESPGLSCKDILAKAPTSKDGLYWLANGGNPVQATCDMTSDGGGWTRIELDVPAGAAGWSNGSLTNATVAGVATPVHGMFGVGQGADKTYGLLGIAHSQVKVRARYYAVDSWDGEGNGAQLWLDGAMKWSATKVWNAAGSGPGWVTATFVPAPWGNNSGPNGYWKVEDALGIVAHSGATLTVGFKTGLDQDVPDESFAFSHVEVWIR
jgi:subtilisin-like proprotein convertase family protein